jgi:drug/metabolite transporter (DMT)-like permease
MPSGLLFGLVAALGWGLTDISAAITGRRLGPIAIAASAQSLGLAVFIVLAVATGVGLDATIALEAALFGVIAGIGYMSAFTALRIGPLAVVSPVMATYGALTVVLAVIFRGEQLKVTDWLGVAFATAGIALAGLVADGGWRSVRPVSIGVGFALLADIGFAVSTVGLAAPIQEAGWLPTMLVSRAANVALVVLVLGIALVLRPPILAGAAAADRTAIRRIAAGIVAIGLLDAGATISFAVGLETSVTWLVGLTSSFGPAIAIVFAVGAMGERLRRSQWLGLVLLGAGVAVLALPFGA